MYSYLRFNLITNCKFKKIYIASYTAQFLKFFMETTGYIY